MTKKIYSIFLVMVLLMLGMHSSAQSFLKEIPGALYFNVKQLPSGNLVIGGQNSAGNLIALSSTDLSGNMLYNKTIKPASGFITFDPTHNRDIMLLDNDSLVFSAWSSGSLGTHNLAFKTDFLGNTGWWKVYQNDGSAFTPRGGSGGMYKTSTQHYISSSWSHHHIGGSFDYGAHIQKTDLAGNPLWSKHFIQTGFAFLWGATELTNGNYLFAGGTSSVLCFNTNPNGNINWMYTYKSGTKSNEGIGVLPTSDNGFIIAGSRIKTTSNTDRDGLLIKIDQQGNVVWAKAIGGSAVDLFYNVRKTNDGNFIAVGETASYGNGNKDGWIVKFSGDGTILWTKTMGTAAAEYINDAVQVNDYLYVVGGYANGALLGAMHNGQRLGCSEKLITPTVMDETASIVRTTQNYASVDFVEPRPDQASTSNVSTTPVLICSVDTVGVAAKFCPGASYNFHGTQLTTPGTYYHQLVSSTGIDSVLQLTLTHYEASPVTITQTGTLLETTYSYPAYQWLRNGNFLPNANAASYTIHDDGIYSLRITDINGCHTISNGITVSGTTSIATAEIYPNPVRSQVNIRFNDITKGVYVTVISSESKKLLTRFYPYANAIKLDISHLPEGTYLLKLQSIDGSKKSFTLLKGK